MNELKEHIRNGRRAIVAIIDWLDDNKVKLPVPYNLDRTLNALLFLDGYIACLEKQNIVL